MAKKLPKARFNPTLKLLETMGVPVAEAVVFLRDAAAQGSDAARKFVGRWDETHKNKRRLNRVEIVCREAGVNPEEVRGILLTSWKRFQRQMAQVKQLQALPDIAVASARAVELPDNSAERMRVLETHELISPQQKGGGVTVQTAVVTGQQQQGPPRGLPSFEEHMRLADSRPKELPAADVDGEIVE